MMNTAAVATLPAVLASHRAVSLWTAWKAMIISGEAAGGYN
jgi:hypothetical protein